MTLVDGKTPASQEAATMTDPQLTGERIAYYRERLGLSRVEFAGLIGRSDSSVSQVERGVRAIDRMSVLQKVADVLSVCVDVLSGADYEDQTATGRRKHSSHCASPSPATRQSEPSWHWQAAGDSSQNR